MNAIVSPVDIKSSQFKAMTSNSIRSVVKSVLDGNVALDRNSPCFAIESISNQKPCPGNNEIKFEKSQIRASSFLETFTENYDDGNVFDFHTFLSQADSVDGTILSSETLLRVELPRKLFKVI